MQTVISILEQVGALLTDDHFVGTSGRHIGTYINKDTLFPHTELASRVCEIFAQKHAHLPIEVVAGPAMGGIILSQWTAYHLSKIKGREILSVYAEKKNDVLAFTRGYDAHVTGKNVLVVEDLTTTGGSLKKVIDLVTEAGGTTIAASVMVNKDPAHITEKTFGVPFYPLAEFQVDSFNAAECPMCRDGVPVNTTVGHGKKFMEKRI